MGLIIKIDGEGKRILPAVKIGNERIERTSCSLSGPNFTICAQHGTVPAVYVRSTKPRAIRRCCGHCIREHCKVTTAILQAISAVQHPNGHSY